MPTNPPKVHYQYSTKDFYKTYSKRQSKGQNVLEYKKYKGFIEDFFICVLEKLVEERWTFYLPHRIGYLQIQSEKKSIMDQPVNHDLSKRRKKLFRHTNNRSYQTIFSFKWIKSYLKFNNSSYYTFKPLKGKAQEKKGTGVYALRNHIQEAATNKTKKLLV